MTDTPEQILESACHVFAEKGYHEAGIAEICERANANVAAVNYHFHSKSDLYVEALRRTFAVAEERRPLSLSAEDTPSPEERLKLYIQAYFHRVFCTGICGCAAKLTAHEMANPTFAHEDVFKNLIAPGNKSLKGIVSELLGPSASKEDIKACMFNIQGMCSFCQFDKHAKRGLIGQNGKLPKAVKNAANHATAFALAGIDASKKQLA